MACIEANESTDRKLAQVCFALPLVLRTKNGDAFLMGHSIKVVFALVYLWWSRLIGIDIGKEMEATEAATSQSSLITKTEQPASSHCLIRLILLLL